MNSDSSFEELLEVVKKKFQSASRFFAHAKMAVEYEGRSFTEDEERQLTREIESAANIEILCIIEKNTVTEQVHKKNAGRKALKPSMKKTGSSIRVH